MTSMKPAPGARRDGGPFQEDVDDLDVASAAGGRPRTPEYQCCRPSPGAPLSRSRRPQC